MSWTKGQRTRWDSNGKVTVEEEEYADDFIGVKASIDESKAALEAMDETFKRFGLAISLENRDHAVCVPRNGDSKGVAFRGRR
eukprot:gene1214-591_t